jgi:hypothetical protein
MISLAELIYRPDMPILLSYKGGYIVHSHFGDSVALQEVSRILDLEYLSLLDPRGFVG